MDYTNCFAHRNTSCTALNIKLCKKGACPFYKPLTKENNYVKIETDIIKYSSTKDVYKSRNHQFYE